MKVNDNVNITIHKRLVVASILVKWGWIY